MRKNVWIVLALLMILPGLLFTVSCAKKAVQSETAGKEQPVDQEALKKQREKEAADAEKKWAAVQAAREAEQRRKAMEEQRLKDEAAKRQAMTERQAFENENIYFEFDSSALTATAQGVLKRKADYLRQNSAVKIVIEGHCDERGTNEYNLALGDRRANSAKTFLVDLGISAGRLNTISYGEERPLDPAHNEEAWAKNRRGHFVVE